MNLQANIWDSKRCEDVVNNQHLRISTGECIYEFLLFLRITAIICLNSINQMMMSVMQMSAFSRASAPNDSTSASNGQS